MKKDAWWWDFLFVIYFLKVFFVPHSFLLLNLLKKTMWTCFMFRWSVRVYYVPWCFCKIIWIHSMRASLLHLKEYYIVRKLFLLFCSTICLGIIILISMMMKIISAVDDSDPGVTAEFYVVIAASVELWHGGQRHFPIRLLLKITNWGRCEASWAKWIEQNYYYLLCFVGEDKK